MKGRATTVSMYINYSLEGGKTDFRICPHKIHEIRFGYILISVPSLTPALAKFIAKQHEKAHNSSFTRR